MAEAIATTPEAEAPAEKTSLITGSEAIAIACQTRRPTSLTHSSSAWTCWRSIWPCCTNC